MKHIIAWPRHESGFNLPMFPPFPWLLKHNDLSFPMALEGHMYITMSRDRPNFLNDPHSGGPSSLLILRWWLEPAVEMSRYPVLLMGAEYRSSELEQLRVLVFLSCKNGANKTQLNSVKESTSICESIYHYHHCKMNPTRIDRFSINPFFPLRGPKTRPL